MPLPTAIGLSPLHHDRRQRPADPDEAGGAARTDLHPARPEPVPACHPGGLLRIDKAKTAAQVNLDGKYLLRCSDRHLPAEDIALGYKQLLQVERRWRDMKTTLELRPVYHRFEDRIRAHVILCWLALLLISNWGSFR